MLIRTVRKPGEPGTQKLIDRYGERLVCVRYRYDPAKGKRYKTVELIVAAEDWRPRRNRSPTQSQRQDRGSPGFQCASDTMKRTCSARFGPSAGSGIPGENSGMRPRKT